MKEFIFDLQRFANIDNSYNDHSLISGTAYNDSIFNNGNNVTINAGKGNDTINNNSFVSDYGVNVLFLYNEGDGNDSIRGFKEHSTLSIGGGEYSTEESGEDVFVTVGDGKITLSGAAKLSTLNIIIKNDDDDDENDENNGNDDENGENNANNNGIALNNGKKETKPTSATITSDFDGDTFDATDYKKLTTIKTSKNFASDIEIIGNSKSNTITSGAGDDTINGGHGSNKIDGGAGNDSIFGGGTGNDTLTGGKGYDIFVYDGKGKDKITDYTAGEDTVSIDGAMKRASVSGSNVVFKVGRSGTLTLDKAVGKKITYIDDNNNEITETFRKEGCYDEDETKLEFFSTFDGTFTASNTLETIDSSKVKDANLTLNITGNARDNSIIGGNSSDNISGGAGDDSISGGIGKDYLDGGVGDDLLFGGTGSDTLRGGSGNDTLKGGSGKNIFVYEAGDDVITDFSASNSNRIQLLNDSITTNYTVGDDLVFDFSGGSLTIQNYNGGAIKFLDANGKESEYIFTDSAILNSYKTRATITSNSYTADERISRIDGSQVDGTEIIGNARNNSIIGSSGNDTLTGGEGNDHLWGGGGSDTFVYNAGDGRDVIYNFSNDDFLEVNGFDDADIIANYNADKNYVKVKLGKGSVTFKDFTATEFNIGSSTWQLSGNSLTKQ